MDIQFDQILYMGAHLHIDMINYFPKCKKFIFIDIEPRNEFDDLYDDRLFREDFVPKLINKFTTNNFIITSITKLDNTYHKKFNIQEKPYLNPHLIKAYNYTTNVQIKYYISTNILFNMNDELKNDIHNCNGLYIAGYLPNDYLFTLLNKDIILIGDNKTIYEDIINYNFKNYYLVYRNENDQFIKYYNYNTMKPFIYGKN